MEIINPNEPNVLVITKPFKKYKDFMDREKDLTITIMIEEIINRFENQKEVKLLFPKKCAGLVTSVVSKYKKSGFVNIIFLGNVLSKNREGKEIKTNCYVLKRGD